MVSSLDVYTQHFGFSEPPFTLVPNPGFIFWSPAHRRAASILEYGILTRAPITMVTGEVGSGKTTLLRHLLKRIQDDIRLGLVSNAFGDRGDLLNWILQSFGIKSEPSEGYVERFGRFQDFVIEEYAAGRRIVLIFDEAQNLSREALEEIRMLTNINADEDVLLQLVLVGQPELRDIIMRPDMAQFAQRVAANFFLPAMNASNVAQYIAHRLSVVGGDPEIFTPGAAELIHQATGGIPRLINQLCDFALLYTFEEGQYQVEQRIVEEVLNDGVFFAGGTPRPLILVHRVDDDQARAQVHGKEK